MSDLPPIVLRKTRAPPGPLGALLRSLLIYPGSAHLRLGLLRTGWTLAAIFTVVLALYLRFSLYPAVAYFAGLVDISAEPQMPAGEAVNSAWLALLLIPYFGTALHAAWMAVRLRSSSPRD